MGPQQQRLQTYQPALARQLCGTSGSQQQQHKELAPATQDKPLASSWEQRKAAQRAALEAKARQKEEAFRAAMQRKREAEAAAREEAFQQVYTEVLGGLEPHGTGVLSDVQETLQYADTAQQARREALHKQWQSQVFEPIQERLQQALSRNSVQQLESSLQDASAAYMQASNTKRLFLDVIIDDGYDPLAPLVNSLRIPTADLADPLLHDVVKTHTEKTLLATGASSSSSIGSSSGSPKRGSFANAGSRSGSLQASTGASRGGPDSTAGGSCFGLAKATTRSMLETQRWAAGQIQATPYGHCIDDRTAQYIIKPAAPQSLAQKTSHVFFDDFSPPV